MTADPITISPDSPSPPPQDAGSGDAAELVAEDRFSIVPEWVLDADIGDCAMRLYAVLLRFGNTTGARMPARSTLAARLRKKSTDTDDRALAELVALGAVQVEPRWAGKQRLTNRYRIRTSRPSRNGPVSPATGTGPGGGRTDAATGTDQGGGGRNDRGRVAARIRHDREFTTEKPPPPPLRAARSGPGRSLRNDTTGQWQARRNRLLADCGIVGERGWDDFVSRVQERRRQAGQPLSRWTGTHLVTAQQQSPADSLLCAVRPRYVRPRATTRD